MERAAIRPRQVRYQAALRPDISTSLILKYFAESRNGHPVFTVAEPCQNPARCTKPCQNQYLVLSMS
ncbi:hypothetical protein SBA3_1180004 [Candidatus Sulfopaludibacter sp. SbA3]|nr:hypothetical protein SBA3_1180004 [Candidatus Sulfopaludibacter sp. SbA3]